MLTDRGARGDVNDAALVVAGRTAVAAGALLATAGSVVSLSTGEASYWWSSYNATITVFTLVFAALVWKVLPGQPRNAAVLAMATTSLCGLSVAAFTVVPLLSDAPSSELRFPDYSPADHPSSVAVVSMVAEVASTIGAFGVLTFGLLLFPHGRLPSPRWRPVAGMAGLAIATMSVSYVWELRPSNTRSPDEGVLGNVGLAVAGVVVLLAMVAHAGRFSTATGVVRQQYKWMLWGTGGLLLSFLVSMAFVPAVGESALLVGSSIGLLVIAGAYGMAVGRYRLYDVDLVISRTIVYVALAATVTGLYVGAVVGVGATIGASDESDMALAIMTTAVVAAAFQPVRHRLQRLVDRLVYGRRVTPHDVLSAFAQRVAAADDELVELIARSLADGTGAGSAEVWMKIEGRAVRVAAWPPDSGRPPVGIASFPVEHQGVELGSLVLRSSAGQRLAEQDRRLAEQVAAGLGLALLNRTLTATLERRVEELCQSRRRLVAVQDETRRRIERDLHDGLQQQLVAIRIKLGLACTIAETDGAHGALAEVRRLVEDAERVVGGMREFASGVYPPLLEAEGLRPVIAAQARRLAIPVEVETSRLGRYDRDIESTVNVCVTEALRNVSRHASASFAWVTVAQQNGTVLFEIGDDGVGFDVRSTVPGAGLTGLADRVAALAGTISVTSTPGAGTTVAGRLPIVAAAEPEPAVGASVAVSG